MPLTALHHYDVITDHTLNVLHYYDIITDHAPSLHRIIMMT